MAVPRNLRPARPDDVTSLVALDAGASVSPWRDGQFAAACSGAPEASETALVLEEDGRICGFIVYSRVLEEACIHNMVVHHTHQGRGLGRSLLDAALRQMKQSGATGCLLEVRESNAAARSLYRGLRFQLDGVRKNYYPTQEGREDALLMSRKL